MASSIAHRAREMANARGVRRARSFVAQFVRTHERNDLLTRASAISFQVLFALVPAMLAGIALLGFFGLEEYWSDELSPSVEQNVGGAAFDLIDSAVQQVLGGRQVFWLTAGALFALWQVSGAVRATGGGLDRIYDAHGERSLWQRVVSSALLAAAVSVIFGLAVLGLFAGPEIIGEWMPAVPSLISVPLARYIIPALLVLLAMALVVRFTCSDPPPHRFIGLTSAITVTTWIIVTLVFRWYVTTVADYESLFAGLASVIVLMTYIYISANVFLGGFQADALVRERIDDGPGRRGEWDDGARRSG